MVNPVIYTIGHSTHPLERFIDLLRQHGITALADVRSQPSSRHNPQFNKDELAPALKAAGIAYVFLGKQLGARSEDPACYENGRVQYDRLARTPLFREGIERVLAGARQYRIVLMCAEKEPLECHRTLLVSRALERENVAVKHILADGRVEEHRDTMSRLLQMAGFSSTQDDMFQNPDERINDACRLQEQKIAYVDESLLETRERARA
jgi:uncharacterized protein (DUF488 family)